jgi:hypothetical protein
MKALGYPKEIKVFRCVRLVGKVRDAKIKFEVHFEIRGNYMTDTATTMATEPLVRFFSSKTFAVVGLLSSCPTR